MCNKKYEKARRASAGPSDPDIFEMEMKYIFEGGWVFLGLSSQIPETNDYLTTRIGRHPVVIMRSKDGSLGCFINSCPHKGAMICHLAKGNSPLHICAYHSWSFDSAGRNRGIKLKTSGAYGSAFDRTAMIWCELRVSPNIAGSCSAALKRVCRRLRSISVVRVR